MRNQNIDRRTGRGRIFVIGDSRTGTTSLHNFFLKNGIKSIHYFMEEAGQIDPIHSDIEGNRKRFLKFLNNSDVTAFSDYPVRFFFRELWEAQPEAKFILTVRKTTDSWVKSMQSFLGSFNIIKDFNNLSSNYESANEEIERLFNSNRYFLKIVIDGDDDNTSIVSKFLGIDNVYPISRDNSSDELDNSIWSKRFSLFGGSGDEALAAMQAQYATSKAVISEFGWCYLVNDSNLFLEYQFGVIKWSDVDVISAKNILDTRINNLDIPYIKFIIPEKQIIYPEYLPRALLGLPVAENRPALALASRNPRHVHYLGASLTDAKSYGQLYFRGDTHPNWLGAWVIYRNIVDRLAPIISSARGPIALDELVPSIAGYDGDLFTQLAEPLRKEWTARWGFTQGVSTFEYATKFVLRDPVAQIVAPPSHLLERFTKRPPLLFERGDGLGPTAVIFRDSTADFLTQYLAEHFSRSLFIWKDGQVIRDIIEEEKPDIVIHIMAERFVSRYPDFAAFT